MIKTIKHILYFAAFISFLHIPIFAQTNKFIKCPEDSIAILRPGDYKKGEFDTTMMDRQWWGIYESNRKTYLKEVRLKLDELEPDCQYDWEYQISVEDEKNCIILISGLARGSKEINLFTTSDILYSDQNFTFEFGPYHPYLSAELKQKTHHQDRDIYIVKINFMSDGILKTQTLFDFPSDGRLIVNIEWAGDLDNDGKTDFLMQIPTEPYNETGYGLGLLLSSMAGPDELVKLVACCFESGC